MPSYITAPNVQIINKIRRSASLEYQQRVPVATQANLQKTMELIHSYEPLWNEFYTTLLNRIGTTFFQKNQFQNRLAPFKRGMNFGAVAQEAAANLITAEAYDQDNTNPWDAQRPDIQVNYHMMNRADVYPMEVNEQRLYEATLNEGELSMFLNGVYDLPNQSAEWDEYVIMRGLFKRYNDTDGIYNIHVNDLVSSADPETDARDLTQKIRAMYLKTKGFYSRKYNAQGMDAMANELVLLITPEVESRNDVYSLATAFNAQYAQWFADNTITVDDFEIPGCQALLVDRDAFQCYNILYKNSSIYNPRTDSLLTYLHARGIYSLSRMRNMMMFSTAEDTETASAAARTVSGVTVSLETPVDNNAILEPGAMAQLNVSVTYNTGDPDALAYYIITAGTSEAAANGELPVILPDTGTYVDRLGVLHVSPDSEYETMVITAVSTVDGTKSGNITLNKVGYTPGA